ncbi:MAG: tRNA (guanosine(37)-N1)-methyltransferase TrmD [Acidobacteria bacterium]|nr:tRNA (guanosine(37)-N1)-methyltransferase TrmD [Acidobacteriota bacterium]
MRFDLLTIFPAFFDSPFEYGVVARARRQGLIEIETHDLREFAFDRHRSVDDRPFGGDEGMVLMVEPLCLALEQLRSRRPEAKRRTVLLSAQGRLFDQTVARRLTEFEEVTLICGRYEGVDERVAEKLIDEEISIGDFVLSGGEWAAGILVDCVARLLPGVLGNEASSRRESFAPDDAGGVGVLDCPHYTRPAEFRGWAVPEELLSGDHEKIRRWRRREALRKTKKNRPDLLVRALLSSEDRELLREIEGAGDL